MEKCIQTRHLHKYAKFQANQSLKVCEIQLARFDYRQTTTQISGQVKLNKSL